MTSDSPLPFKLPPPALEDLARLVELSEQLPNIVEFAESLVREVPFQDYSNRIARRFDIPTLTVEAALNALQGFRRIQEILDMNGSQLVAAVNASVLRDAPDEWKDKHLDGWQKSREAIASVFTSLTKDNAIVLRWKTDTLSSAHQNVLGDSIILTDVRPTFNQAGDEVIQATVSHTLLIDYLAGSERKRVQFALDSSDIEQLKEACERAQRKADTVRKSLACIPWPTSIPRDPRAESKE